MTARPPDDWGEAAAPAEPPATSAAARVRAAWVAHIRRRHLAATGLASRYNSHPQWDGGHDSRTGRTYRVPFWPKVVARAAAAGLDPVRLVETLFAGWADDANPSPQDILGAPNLARAAGEKAAARRLAEAALRTEEAVFTADAWGARQSTADPQAADRQVLDDTGRPLSPLFRYAAAVLRGYADVAARWAAAAHSQFRTAPDAYRAVWGRILPDEFRTA